MFKYDNPLFNFLNKVADCMLLSVLWLVFSLPIITAGTASAALYYTTVKVVRKENGYAWREFYGFFRREWKQTTVIWLIWLAICVLLGLLLVFAYKLAPTNGAMGIAAVMLIILLSLAILTALLTIAYCARFEFPTKRMMLNALLIGFQNIGRLIVLWLLLLAGVWLLMYIPLAIVIMAGPFCLVASYILERLFKRYMSEEDWHQDLEQGRKQR